MKERASGILLHISSLPSPCGIGDLGSSAYKFVDFLAEAKQKYWQILPLNPTDTAYDNSPYSSISAFAGNRLLISPELLIQQGLLKKSDIGTPPSFPQERSAYFTVSSYKEELFHRAYGHFIKIKVGKYEYEKFCQENSHWLEDYALFVALKEHFHRKAWNRWQSEIRDRQSDVLLRAKGQLKDRVEKEKFIQFIFFQQWSSLKSYGKQKAVYFLGDVPIYVNYDSVEVWANPEIFKLDERKRAIVVSGVPPDYFSRTGQLWGNPIYRWDRLKERGYGWWIQRMKHNLHLFDLIRIDHFRGFVAFWEVPAGEKTATYGRWVKAPAEDFFSNLSKQFPHLPVIAEDLGVITPDVREIMRRFRFPGMRVLLFAFGEDNSEHPYLPHNYSRECVVYTGTHDNNTVRGWLEKEATPEDKRRLFGYLGRETTSDQLPWELIRLAMMSVAKVVIIPMQDILELGEEARMNRPGSMQGNWRWRMLPDQLTTALADRLKETTKIYGRA